MKLYCFVFLMFIAGCSSQYHEHFFRENPELSQSQPIFSWEVFHSDGRVESLPDTTTQSRLIDSIDSAKKRIWIEIYTWTEAAHLMDPIVRAKKRWVDIQVVIEGNVYGTPKINNPIVKKLKEEWVPVIYADNNRYSFTHAKFWIIDDIYSISTGNWTASFFTKNREYIYSGKDRWTLLFLEEIFLSDVKHLGYKDTLKIPSQIVISPLNARERIEDLINSTQENIIFYVQTLDDEHILWLIQFLYDQKKKVYICTADNETNRARVIQYPLWNWKLIKKPYLHAKVILVDYQNIFIGSHNLTTNAIENNREIGIILRERNDLYQKIERDFQNDGCMK